MYRIEREDCFLDLLALLPGERRRGYGRTVFSDLLRDNPGIRTVRLDVQKRNRNALAFYESLGFTAESEELQPVGDGTQPYLNMVLVLPGKNDQGKKDLLYKNK